MTYKGYCNGCAKFRKVCFLEIFELQIFDVRVNERKGLRGFCLLVLRHCRIIYVLLSAEHYNPTKCLVLLLSDVFCQCVPCCAVVVACP